MNQYLVLKSYKMLYIKWSTGKMIVLAKEVLLL